MLAGTDEGATRSLREMAGDAYASPFHFSRLLSRLAGEPPAAMRRRVMLERAAWQLRQGQTVTDVAWAAGYSSVEGFTRAFSKGFGHPPSVPARSHWLPAANGIHYHPPMALWVSSREHAMNPLTEQLVSHELDDTRALLEIAKGLPEEELRAVWVPGLRVMEWDSQEESIIAVLEHLVWNREVWLAAIEGADMPQRDENAARDGVNGLIARHDATAGRWLAVVRDIDARGGWDDRMIDALCEPPESFVLSGVIAHVLEYSAHRRQLVRHMLRAAGRQVGAGDPINWLRRRRGEETGADDE